MDLPQAPPTTGDASPSSGVVNVTVGVVEDQPSNGDVAAVISATIPSKRKRIPKVFFKEAAAGAAPAATPAAAAKGGRVKTKAAGPRGAQPKAKKPTTRVGLAAPPSKAATLPAAAAAAVPPAPTPPVADARQVLDDEPTTTYMDMLNAGTVDLDAGIGAFDEELHGEEYGDYGDDEEGDEEVDDDVVEVDPAAAGSSAPPSFLFYGVGIRGLLVRTSFRPVESEYRALYSRYKGQKNRGSVRHALRAALLCRPVLSEYSAQYVEIFSQFLVVIITTCKSTCIFEKRRTREKFLLDHLFIYIYTFIKHDHT